MHICSLLHGVDIHNTWECNNYVCMYIHTYVQYSTLQCVMYIQFMRMWMYACSVHSISGACFKLCSYSTYLYMYGITYHVCST